VALRLVGSCQEFDEVSITMAERKRMTAEEVVGYLVEGGRSRLLRESLTWICQQLMEAEGQSSWAQAAGSGARRSG
jgi:hypothetical protein